MRDRHARKLSWCLLGLAHCAITPVPAGAQPEPAPEERVQDERVPTTDDAVIERLQSSRTDADYEAQDLDRIIADLRERFDLNIHMSWRKLEEVGIRRDLRITLNLRNVTLDTLLGLILREASTNVKQLDYVVSDGVIIISTDNLLAQDTLLRAYGVADLIESGYAIRRFANTPVLALETTGREFWGGEDLERAGRGGFSGGEGETTSHGGGSIFGDPGDDLDRISNMERAEQIIDLLQQNITPEQWQDFGGETASLSYINGTLLIRHTLSGHREIAQFLKLLRDAQPSPLIADVRILRMRRDKLEAWRAEVGESFPVLPADQAAELWQGGAEDQDVLFSGTTTGHDGQRLWFSSLTQRDVVVSYVPVLAEHATGYRPDVGQVTEGLELIILPLVQPESERLTLDVQFAWIPPVAVSPRPVALGGDVENGSVDQVERSMRTVSAATTLSLGDAAVFTIPDDPARGADDFEEVLVVRTRAPAQGTPAGRVVE